MSKKINLKPIKNIPIIILLASSNLFGQIWTAEENVDKSNLSPWIVDHVDEYEGTYFYGESEAESVFTIAIAGNLITAQLENGDWNIENETKDHQLNLICDIKWGIYYRKPEYLEINTEISESDQKLARTAFEWDPKTNWIVFNRDGTCKIKDSETDKILSKNWSLDEKGIVFPTGWTEERFSNKVIFEILNLDNDEFNVTELDISPNITLRNEVKMKRIKL